MRLSRLEVCLDMLFSMSFSARFIGACALKIEINNYISAITAEVSNYKRWLAVKTLALIQCCVMAKGDHLFS